MQAQRLFDTLEELSTCNATPGNGVTRFSWSEADSRARRVLERELKAIGLEPWTDGMGNLHARIEGSTGAPAVLTGSHLDTVRNGGRYDGTYGVVAALEALRSFHDEGYKPERAIEFIAFAEEEGSNFGSTCLGSKGIAGQIGVEGLKRLSNAEGSAYDALRAFGLDPDALPGEQIDPVRAFLEVHIEQNAMLEDAGRELGIVTAISGMRLHRIVYKGHSDHAASPMQGRRDPAAGFAELAFRMEQLWKDGDLPEDFSCTIGELACSPNVGIVVPESVIYAMLTCPFWRRGGSASNRSCVPSPNPEGLVWSLSGFPPAGACARPPKWARCSGRRPKGGVSSRSSSRAVPPTTPPASGTECRSGFCLFRASRG